MGLFTRKNKKKIKAGWPCRVYLNTATGKHEVFWQSLIAPQHWIKGNEDFNSYEEAVSFIKNKIGGNYYIFVNEFLIEAEIEY